MFFTTRCAYAGTTNLQLQLSLKHAHYTHLTYVSNHHNQSKSKRRELDASWTEVTTLGTGVISS